MKRVFGQRERKCRRILSFEIITSCNQWKSTHVLKELSSLLQGWKVRQETSTKLKVLAPRYAVLSQMTELFTTAGVLKPYRARMLSLYALHYKWCLWEIYQHLICVSSVQTLIQLYTMVISETLYFVESLYTEPNFSVTNTAVTHVSSYHCV
jgi:hypothetical protein